MTSLLISVAGALIAFLATALCGVLAFMGKFALSTLDKRIDDAKSRLLKVEESTLMHGNQLASQKTQTEAESRRFEELATTMSDLRTKIDELATAVSDLTGQLRRTK